MSRTKRKQGIIYPVSIYTVQLNSGNCILIFWLIARVGPTRTLIVTYLLPCMALVYGALLLHEPVGLNTIGGLALVLIGIFVTSKKTEQRTATSAATETTVREPQTGW